MTSLVLPTAYTSSIREERGVATLDAPEIGTRRGRGRPRDPGMDSRILVAARQAAAELGIDRCSMEIIASSAGVGKPTVYLRWPDRWAVMVAALEDLPGPPEPSSYEGIVAAVWAAHRYLVAGRQAPFFRAVLDASARDERLQAALEASLLNPWQSFIEQVAARRLKGVVDAPSRPAREIAELVKAQLVLAMVRPNVDARRWGWEGWIGRLDRRLLEGSGGDLPATELGLSLDAVTAAQPSAVHALLGPTEMTQ